jgi:anti-repressor protein
MTGSEKFNGRNEIVPFDFEGAAVRTVTVDGDSYLVGKDVTERLGYANAADAISKHCKGVAKRYPLMTAGGMQEVRVLSEPDVLRLIIGSNLPAAERFERWVFEDVLPSIRRTGADRIRPGSSRDDVVTLARNILLYHEQVGTLEADVALLAPKAAAHDLLSTKTGEENITTCAKALGRRPGWMFDWLSLNGWTFRARDGAPWRAYQSKIEGGYLAHRERPDRTRDDRSFVQVMVTPKGRAKLAELLARSDAPRGE